MLLRRWRRWVSNGPIDEFSRIEAIKGQRAANVLTAFKPRRRKVAQALAGCETVGEGIWGPAPGTGPRS
ncbi:hypothetical protein OG589_24415 [Sphaerisporangium sp. NBC_01403]|uniref:hypothetical protein n=1 Tax=Sphaerisporangium sp. NBC_01403 TaxID=2903599 RepID=UPI0032483F53